MKPDFRSLGANPSIQKFSVCLTRKIRVCIVHSTAHESENSGGGPLMATKKSAKKGAAKKAAPVAKKGAAKKKAAKKK
jgi:hypothetical protein